MIYEEGIGWDEHTKTLSYNGYANGMVAIKENFLIGRSVIYNSFLGEIFLFVKLTETGTNGCHGSLKVKFRRDHANAMIRSQIKEAKTVQEHQLS